MSLSARTVHRRDEWNTLVLGTSNPDFRQCWQWGAVRASRNWDVLRVAVTRGDTAVAAAQVLTRRAPGLGVVLYAPRGPLVADGEAGWQAVPALLEHVRAETGGHVLELNHRPVASSRPAPTEAAPVQQAS
jgi:lipid II:glycine glycyltransferase (peptidoglycan interpeptide bridge formation enzyme)